MSILLESNEILVCSSFVNLEGDLVVVGRKREGLSYNRATQILSLRRDRKIKVYKNVIEKSEEEATEYVISLHYRNLLKDEVYFFFNNDPKQDHLDSERMNDATLVLSLEELEGLVRLIIPSGRGEYGFTKIEQIKEKARELVDNEHTYITHIEIRT